MANPFKEYSSRNEVRADISNGGWTVIWGKHIDDMEYAKCAASLATGSFFAYFQSLLGEVIASFGKGIVLQVFENPGNIVRVGTTDFRAGIATYRYWHYVKTPVKIESWNPLTWEWGWREEKVALRPNTHQPYIKYRSTTLSQQDQEIAGDPAVLAIDPAKYRFQWFEPLYPVLFQ